MKLSDFAIKVAKKEGKKRSISIAQIKEVLRIVNQLCDGELYYYVRNKL